MTDTNVDVRRPWWRRRWGIATIAVVAVAVIGGAMSDEADEPDPAEPAATEAAPEPEPAEAPGGEPGGDASAELACRHFRNVAADANAGILSDDELREKVAEIHNSGRVSETAGIAEGTQALLAAVTQQDGTLGAAIQELADACDPVDS